MKKKDMTLIVAIAIFVAVFALVISNIFLASPGNLTTEVESVPVITAEFPEVDTNYFNSQSENPTQLIRISENENKNPFPTKSDDD